jgi:hypothetical protein
MEAPMRRVAETIAVSAGMDAAQRAHW